MTGGEFKQELERLAGGELDEELLRTALTHSSASNEVQGLPCNERLEFLGDAVLELAVSEWIFRLYPEASEGELTRLRARMVCGEQLAEAAAALGIGSQLLLGKGEEVRGGRNNKSILGSAFEAVVGAVFLSLGYEHASQFVRRVLVSPEKVKLGRLNDPKSLLQQLLQAAGDSVSYKVVSTFGPPHQTEFMVAAVSSKGIVLGEGKGRSKKQAEQRAAEDALRKGNLLQSEGANQFGDTAENGNL
ncbi:MAG: ribonuclease III [Bacillota bacterium]